MKSNNQINVPQARDAMDKFKMQAASEEDVPGAYRNPGKMDSRPSNLTKKMEQSQGCTYSIPPLSESAIQSGLEKAVILWQLFSCYHFHKGTTKFYVKYVFSVTWSVSRFAQKITFID